MGNKLDIEKLCAEYDEFRRLEDKFSQDCIVRGTTFTGKNVEKSMPLLSAVYYIKECFYENATIELDTEE